MPTWTSKNAMFVLHGRGANIVGNTRIGRTDVEHPYINNTINCECIKVDGDGFDSPFPSQYLASYSGHLPVSHLMHSLQTSEFEETL